TLRHSVADLAVNPLRVRQETKGSPRQRAHNGVRIRFARRDDQDSRHVISAVAVFRPGLDVVGVFERAAIVGHRRDVSEARPRGSRHAVTTRGAATLWASASY